MSKILVLGSMPENADPARHIAAGPWCFAGREEKFPGWEKCFQFAPEPSADTENLSRTARQAQQLCIKAIPHIARILAADADKYPSVYWETLLLPWAIAISSQIVERWNRLQTIIAKYPSDIEAQLLSEDMNFNFTDENDFNLRGCLGITFNWWLFSRLLEKSIPSGWKTQVIKSSQDHDAPLKTSEKNPVSIFRKKIWNILLSMPFPRLKGMSIWQSFAFSLALLHPCRSTHETKSLSSIFNESDETETLPPANILLPIFIKSLPGSIKKLNHSLRTLKKRNSLKIASINAYENSEYRKKLASWKAGGGKLAFVQHGGNYGQIKVCCNAAIVEYTQEIFFTWGWKSQGRLYGNFKPMPYPQLNRIRNAWKQKTENILFVGTEMACYSYRLESRPTPLQFLQYRNDKEIFLKNSLAHIKNNILYRPYFSLPGVLEDARWIKSRFPEIRICKGPLAPHLLKCKLLVLDHHGTTMLEAFAADIPAILYWNPEHWQLTRECETFLKELEKAGIWYDDPRKAAAKLNEVADNPAEWWHTSQVQKARENYCNYHARTIKSGINSCWISTLLKL